jgi:FAS-associated factor 1
MIHFLNFLVLGDLKEVIFQQTSVPLCRQQIKGWLNSTSKEAQNDSTILKSLRVSKENNIFLTDMTNEGISDDVEFVSAEPPPMYQLRILYTNENRTLNLNFASSKTLLDIKNDIYAVLKVPVRHQKWTGWPQPESSYNAKKLSELGINAIHNLTLKRDDMSKNNPDCEA